MEEAAAKAAKRTSHSGSGGLSVHASKPSRQAFAMKLCQAIRSVPVLVVKANSRVSCAQTNAHCFVHCNLILG